MSEMFEKAKARITERIESPRNLLEFKLGGALKMEYLVLDMLGDLEEEARGDGLKQQLRNHALETRGQIENIEQAFAALGVEPDQKPCPAIEALDKESRAILKLAADQMTDAVILAAAAETEHYEIAVYETLIAHAEALGLQDVAARMRENLSQEQRTLEEVERAMRAAADRLSRQAVQR